MSFEILNMIAFINLHVSWDDDFLTVVSIMIWDCIEHDDLGHVCCVLINSNNDKFFKNTPVYITEIVLKKQDICSSN